MMNRKIEVKLLLDASQYKGGMEEALRKLKEMEGVSVKADAATSKLGLALKGVAAVAGLGVVAKQLADIGVGAVQAAEDINKMRGSIGALIAANHQVRDSSGQLVTGIEKIKAVGAEVNRVFEKIQIDAMKTSDTTQGLIEKFTVALGPGLAAGLDVDQIQKLTTALSVSMSALSIDASQAKSEIKALFSGENLQDADLARALGLRKQDIELARQQGKLYDLLTEKTKDFVAAGELQAESLTGVTSSLDDVWGRLQVIAGQRATDTLAKGFGSVLDSILQVDDKGVAKLDKSIELLSINAGLYIDDTAQAFVWLVQEAVKAAKAIGETMATINYGGRLVQANFEDADARLKLNARRMQLQDRMFMPMTTIRRPQALRGLSDADFAAAEKELAAIAQQEAGLEAKRIEKIDKGYRDTLGAVDYRPATRPAGRGGNGRGGGVTLTPNARPQGDPDKAAKEAEKEENDRISGLMREMGQEIAISDAKDGGPEGRIAIIDRYIKMLGASKQAEDELDKLRHDRTMAQIERDKAAAKAKADAEAQRLAVTQATAEATDAIQAWEVDNDLARTREASTRKQAALNEQYQRGELSIRDYYAKLQAAREEDIKREAKAEEAKLRIKREAVNRAMGATTDPVERAKLQGEADLLAKQIAAIGPQTAQSLASVREDIGNTARDAIAEGATQGFEMALQAAFAGDLDGMQTALRQNFVKALTDAFKNSGLAEQVGKGLGLDSLPAGSGDLGTIGVAAVLSATWDAMTIGERANKGNKDAKATFEEAMGRGPDAITQKYKGIRDKMKKERTYSQSILGIEFNKQEGWILPEEEAELQAEEARDRAEAAKQAVGIWEIGLKAAQQAIKAAQDRAKAEKAAADEAWKGWSAYYDRQHAELKKLSDAKFRDAQISSIYGFSSETLARYDKIKRDRADAQAVINQAVKDGTANNRNTAYMKAKEDIQRYTDDLNLMNAQIRRGQKDTAADLELEIARLTAGDSPEEQRQLRYKEIEADIKARREQAMQMGLTGGGDTATGSKISALLESIEDAMKAQVDKDLLGTVSKANPLPVAVVEMPRLFALPTSAYFRERQGPTVTLAAGAVQINGSGLDEASLQRVTTRAIVAATSAINRENALRGEQLSL